MLRLQRLAPDSDAGAAAATLPAVAADPAPADDEAGPSASGADGGKGAEWFELKNNTSVYVTGLPDDATVEEVAEEFSKCGVVKAADDGTLKIKLYRCEATCLLQRRTQLCF